MGGADTIRPGTALSPREWDVARQTALGLRVKEVANTLDISPHTVKRHRESIYRRLGVESAMDMCRELGWLKVPVG